MSQLISFFCVYCANIGIHLQLKDAVKETLKIFAENISLNYVSLKVLLFLCQFLTYFRINLCPL